MPRSSRAQTATTTLAKEFDWAEITLAEDLVQFGKTLDELVASDPEKLTKAVLAQKLKELRDQYMHAATAATAQGPQEEGVEEEEKEESRVANRAANAKSAAGAKGVEGAAADKMVADAVALEREKLAVKAKADAVELAKATEAANKKVAAAEKAHREADQAKEVAEKAVESERKEKDAELVRTRARLKAAEDAKSRLEQAAKKRPVEEGEEDADEADDQPPKKSRKTKEEQKEAFLESGKSEEQWDAAEQKKAGAVIKRAAAKKELLRKELLATEVDKYDKLKSDFDSVCTELNDHEQARLESKEVFGKVKRDRKVLRSVLDKLIKDNKLDKKAVEQSILAATDKEQAKMDKKAAAEANPGEEEAMEA